MTHTAKRLKLCLPLLGVVAACSDYFGPGPDPSRAGPCDPTLPNCAVLSSSGRNGVGGSGNVGGNNNISGKGSVTTGGSGPVCAVTDPLDSALGIGNADCPDVRSCAQKSCSSQIQQCLGPNYERGTVGGSCKTLVDCASGCACNDNCVTGCTNSADNGTCVSCLLTLQNCLQSSCSAQLQTCQDQSGKPTVLTANLGTNINALAVDDDSLYFTTNTGIAKIPKTGGTAMALGGFNNPNGLAVAGGFIYVVVNTGDISRLKVDGSQPTTIVTSMFGGGPGPIVVDDANLYNLAGSEVRRAPLTGGVASRLVDDVWQMGFNNGQRIALDATTIYYVGQSNTAGAKPQLSMVKKDAAAFAQDNAGMHPGTSLVAADGEIRGIVSDNTFVYFADLASDGLKMALEIRKLDPKRVQTTQLASLSSTNNAGGTVTMATDGMDVYVGADNSLFGIPVGGGDSTTLVDNTFPTAIVLDDTYVYWAEQSNNGVIKRMPKAGPP